MIIKVCGLRDSRTIQEEAALAINWIGQARRSSGQWTVDN